MAFLGVGHGEAAVEGLLRFPSFGNRWRWRDALRPVDSANVPDREELMYEDMI